MHNKYTIPFLLGGFVFSIMLVVVSFSQGWVMTASQARADVTRMTEKAEIDLLTPICVHQFTQQGGGAADLQAMRALDPWRQRLYISERGWATMPGSEFSRRDVAERCGEFLLSAAK